MREEVRIAAALSKINLGVEELSCYSEMFKAAFSALEALKNAIADCEPLVHGIEGVPCGLRADEPSGEFGRQALFAVAPDVQDGCFAVPRILE